MGLTKSSKILTLNSILYNSELDIITTGKISLGNYNKVYFLGWGTIWHCIGELD